MKRCNACSDSFGTPKGNDKGGGGRVIGIEEGITTRSGAEASWLWDKRRPPEESPNSGIIRISRNFDSTAKLFLTEAS